MQPLIGYNYGSDWYVATAPIITANWRMAGNRAWTLPVGGGFGRVVRIGGETVSDFFVQPLLERSVSTIRPRLAIADAYDNYFLKFLA